MVESPHFYFAYSYKVPVDRWTVAVCTCDGALSAIVQRDNFYGVQFHPEKSCQLGLRLISYFLSL
ncbi:glutamine amidotransferase-related protein [Pajaroellobacter abortibovis]|uniref:Glutamine amidotransferase domain-containing protein n=1 Tax=Pajaroellobacter abortibovis TaxID=1882918 RepID=A0A1L6MZ81_9BACT|nr:hypothetical protein BCY86_08590 [Pajaroellobacter abortibovis]